MQITRQQSALICFIIVKLANIMILDNLVNVLVYQLNAEEINTLI